MSKCVCTSRGERKRGRGRERERWKQTDYINEWENKDSLVSSYTLTLSVCIQTYLRVREERERERR